MNARRKCGLQRVLEVQFVFAQHGKLRIDGTPDQVDIVLEQRPRSATDPRSAIDADATKDQPWHGIPAKDGFAEAWGDRHLVAHTRACRLKRKRRLHHDARGFLAIARRQLVQCERLGEEIEIEERSLATRRGLRDQQVGRLDGFGWCDGGDIDQLKEVGGRRSPVVERHPHRLRQHAHQRRPDERQEQYQAHRKQHDSHAPSACELKARQRGGFGEIGATLGAQRWLGARAELLAFRAAQTRGAKHRSHHRRDQQHRNDPPASAEDADQDVPTKDRLQRESARHQHHQFDADERQRPAQSTPCTQRRVIRGSDRLAPERAQWPSQADEHRSASCRVQ